MNDSEMEIVVKRIATFIGAAFLIISIYFSYDGFDQKVTGGNAEYDTLAKVIGVLLAVGFSVIQFILNSRYDQLNLTLKFMGFATYIYSIWTNFMGIQHILGMAPQMAFAVALTLDIVPEPMIAWSFGDAAKGDLIGNMSRWVLGTGGKKQNNQPNQQSQQQNQNNNRPKQKNNQHNQHKQSRPDFQAADFRRDYVDEDGDEESDTQPQFRPQRQASFGSFGGSGGSKKSNGGFHDKSDRRVRDDLKGRIGKR